MYNVWCGLVFDNRTLGMDVVCTYTFISLPNFLQKFSSEEFLSVKFIIPWRDQSVNQLWLCRYQVTTSFVIVKLLLYQYKTHMF